MAGLPLFERYRVPPAAPGSQTSEEAAVAIAKRAPAMCERIRVFLVSRGEHGATRQEISDALGVKIQTVCPRVAELLERTQVVATARRRESREVLVAKEAESL